MKNIFSQEFWRELIKFNDKKTTAGWLKRFSLPAIIGELKLTRCFVMAGNLAYISILAIVPLMAVSFSILTAFPIFSGIQDTIQKFILTNFVTAFAQTVQEHLQQFLAQTTQLSISGLVMLLITAFVLIAAVEKAFNDIWQVKNHRKFTHAFLLYWAILTFIPILVGGSFLFSSYLLKNFLGEHVILFSVLSVLMPYICTYLGFYFMYLVVPNCSVSAKQAAVGALIAGILFEIARILFGWYMAYFADYTLIYGALAVIPTFLVWLYLFWTIVLLGAVFASRVGAYS